MDSPAVSLKIENRVATIRLDRAEALNALGLDLLEGIRDAIRRIRGEQQNGGSEAKTGVVVLRGAGEKAFAAGADIKLMQRASRSELGRFVALGQEVMREIERTPLPVLAVVHGFALGGGLELAMACDLIVAGDRAKLGQPEVNLGLIPGFGGTQRLTARVGSGNAKRLIFTGEAISAEEAFRIGLVDWLVPQDQLEDRVAQITEMLLAKSSPALAAAKRSIDNFTRAALLAGLREEAEAFADIFETEDAKEGLAAFLEKRPPAFKGR